MRVIQELTQLGYIFWLEGNKARYFFSGDHPDPDQVRPMLHYLHRHREEAASFLGQIEAEVADLLDQIDTMDQLGWCRQWATIMTKLGARCTGFDTWADWLADMEEFLSFHGSAGNCDL